MFKKVTYNTTEARKRGVYEAEYEVLHEFNGSGNLNMRLEYDSIKEAVNARIVIKRYTEQAKMSLISHQSGKYVYIYKKERNNGEF